ncbi:MAG: UDP-glucose 6-dehydrogenase [Gammaproteobacteria bacterium]|nr:UDP-glucose 6-dehydrogenase [Gammaproteobacteria bacterium]|tara:strand:- start:599 stop:1963 length:1365 start_codon:yes stop_codon:yes gene_type:complete
MKATFYGIGYVGLVQAAVLADAGHHICCVDIDEKKINDLKNGIIPIYEPELTSLVDRNHLAGRLRFTNNAEEGVKFSNFQFIAVGTPPDEDGSADLQYVLKVAESIATHMQSPKIIVDKSTVPVGTADMVKAKIAEVLASRGESISYSVVSNPEFLKEGAAVKDCQRPDRIIIGTDSEDAEEAMRELYAPFNRNHDKIIVMDIRSAELTKYAANCMLATKISFMNEIANIAEQVGADIEQVRHGIGSDPRIGYQFIYPGCGYGGSCFPKDVQALIHTANTLDYKPEILEAVEAVNSRQKNKLFDYVCRHFGVTEQKKTGLHNKTFALWGLSFKPNTDDMREAPSRALMESLWAADARVQAYDPQAMEEAKRIYGEREDFILCDSKESALEGADALLICTEWQSFRAPDFEQILAALNEPLIFDGRNIYDPEKMVELGFSYYAIGRGLSVTGGKA